MKIRILTALLLLFLFTTCKKEKKTTTTSITASDIVGNWTLTSYYTNFGQGVNATISQYPCMQYNISTYNSDFTSVDTFLGSDTCFITQSHLRADGAQWSGTPQTDPKPSTWSLSGNILYLTYKGNPHHIPGQIARVNNKLQITFKDTVPSGSHIYYITSTEVKQ